MQNKNILLLRSVFCTELVTTALLVGIFETDLLPVGTLPLDKSQEYILSMVGVVLTIIGIPLALKLMTLKPVRAQISVSEQRYVTWSMVRIALLGIPLLYNTLMYYLLGFNTTCCYLALMCVVAFIFIWPSQERMQNECEVHGNQEES